MYECMYQNETVFFLQIKKFIDHTLRALIIQYGKKIVF